MRLLATFLCLWLAAGALAQAEIDYQRVVRPILSDRCYQCHGPDAQERKAGLRLDRRGDAVRLLESGSRAIDPDGESELLRRIHAEDPDERMPPVDSGKALTVEERAILTQWIAQGAPYRQHWSFVAPRKRPTPTGGEGAAVSAIDFLVGQRLRQQGLSLSPEASKERLIRRVTFDLTGMPPTLSAVDAFLADDAGGAYARVVERLLASEKFGEHRARYWLDAARYGDTHGYHLDNYRSIWPYRDWVIAAFNANMPFDQFTIEQLAGDLLPEPGLEQVIATGFNRCNPTTAEGGLIEAEYLAHYAADRVETTSTVWLGLTVGCAKCHDHKFDPISQRDYYRMFAFFNSIDEEGTDRNIATPKPVIPAPTPEQRQQQEALREQQKRLARSMNEPMPEVDARQQGWERQWVERLEHVWEPVVPETAVSREQADLRVAEDGTVLATGKSPAKDVYEFEFATELPRLTALRIEALVHDEAPGGGVGRAGHNNIVLTDVSLHRESAATPGSWEEIEFGLAAADWAQQKFAVAKAIDQDGASGWAIAGGVKADRVAVFAPDASVALGASTRLRLRLAFESRFAQHTIGKLRLSVSAASEPVPARLGGWEVTELVPAPNAKAAFARTPEELQDVTWQPRPEFVDDRVHMLPGAVGTTFLRRTIESPNAREMKLSLGSDDGVRVYLNGELAFENDARRPVAVDQDRATLALREGANELVLAISNGGGGHAFFFRVLSEHVLGLPDVLVDALAIAEPERTAAQRRQLRDYYRRRESPEWAALEQEREGVKQQLAALDKEIPRTLIMKERKEPRPAHILFRGKYDQPREQVGAGVLSVLGELPADSAPDRLALARWLVDEDHPLTARVTVNRFWQSLFGTGLVETAEDFGSQGSWPTNPELLDWLAREFIDSGWDIKHMFRLMVTSDVYRQSAQAIPERFAADPTNRQLARGPRFRLDAEMIRDQALALGGLLVDQIGGPSVKPYQPDGLWRVVAYPSSNTSKFVQDKGDKLYRRSLYTFWKRTSPNPSMQTLDAPSREFCRVRRARTNTPLQALTLLNDVQFVEAARAFATRILREGGGSDLERAEFAFRSATGRRPDVREREILQRAIEAQRAQYGADAAAAKSLVNHGDSAPPSDLPAAELAAWTVFANMILNLDETLTKG